MWSDPEVYKGLMLSALGALVALLFGLLKYAQLFLQPKTPPFKWWVAVINGASAAASGLLATWLLIEWGVDQRHLGLFGAITAIAGWSGVELLDALKEAAYDFLRKRLNGTTQGSKDEGPKP